MGSGWREGPHPGLVWAEEGSVHPEDSRVANSEVDMRIWRFLKGEIRRDRRHHVFGEGGPNDTGF